ncbi:MAG: phosphotriesterase [Balneolaceae bacterium]|nr:MAG: phosphotriesterase [Balneolaceae bacterium]
MRHVLVRLSIWMSILLLTGCLPEDTDEQLSVIHTVHGQVDAREIGFTLSHEHLMSNFGMPIEETFEYGETALYSQVIPYAKKVKELGVNTIFDYTANYFGRRVDILKTISDSTGLQIVTNTGIYGAADDRYIPDYAYHETSEELAARWIDEFRNGIDGTGIRPGFIKLAFDDGEPSEIDTKLFEAGVITHLETGLTIAVHTGSNLAAVQTQFEILEKYSVSPEAWIWTHANWHDDTGFLLSVASMGGWISLDGVKEENTDEFISRLEAFRDAGLLHKVLLSHDGDAWPMGGEIRPFHAIFTHLLPAMRENGYSENAIHQILSDNPSQAYSIKKRIIDI